MALDLTNAAINPAKADQWEGGDDQDRYNHYFHHHYQYKFLSEEAEVE